jgi:hypothetical protein
MSRCFLFVSPSHQAANITANDSRLFGLCLTGSNSLLLDIFTVSLPCLLLIWTEPVPIIWGANGFHQFKGVKASGGFNIDRTSGTYAGSGVLGLIQSLLVLCGVSKAGPARAGLRLQGGDGGSPNLPWCRPRLSKNS